MLTRRCSVAIVGPVHDSRGSLTGVDPALPSAPDEPTRSRPPVDRRPRHPIRRVCPVGLEVSRGPFLVEAIHAPAFRRRLLGSMGGRLRRGLAGRQAAPSDKAVFFVADGLRQDIVAKYADAGLVPDDGLVPQEGTSCAPDNGLLTQAPPNTGRRLVQPRDRRLAGRDRLDQQHVPHQRGAVPNRTAAFDAGVLQAETIAQAAERGGLKVAQIEWAGGRDGDDQRPDDRLPRPSSRAAAWRPTTSAAPATRRRDLHRRLRPAVRPSGRLRRPGGLPGRRSVARRRLDERPDVLQPRPGDAPAGARLRHRQVRPERLPLRLHEQRRRQLRQGPLLADQGRRRRRRAHSPRASGPTSRSRSSAAPTRQDRRHAGQGRGADRGPVAGPPLPHLGHPRQRHLAVLARRARLQRRLRPSTSRSASRARRPPTSRSSRRASSARRPTSSRVSTGPRPTTR